MYKRQSLNIQGDEDLEKLMHVQHELEARDGWRLQQVVESTLSRLQLPADKTLAELSGGWRRRVLLAQALVSEPDLLLLDEPTTFLDVAHQVDLMELLAHLNAQGRTLVAVLHDLNHAARYASHIIAMREGRIVAEGPPSEVITSERVQQVFGLANVVIDDPVTGGPLVVPLRGSIPAGVRS